MPGQTIESATYEKGQDTPTEGQDAPGHHVDDPGGNTASVKPAESSNEQTTPQDCVDATVEPSNTTGTRIESEDIDYAPDEAQCEVDDPGGDANGRDDDKASIEGERTGMLESRTYPKASQTHLNHPTSRGREEETRALRIHVPATKRTESGTCQASCQTRQNSSTNAQRQGSRVTHLGGLEASQTSRDAKRRHSAVTRGSRKVLERSETSASTERTHQIKIPGQEAIWVHRR
ncbi:hypothetical protein EV363DRAFT_1361394 [Boletus edulis]|nr:hypothetical protein EV363DRAFT_1361394 [Boletus edulis]